MARPNTGEVTEWPWKDGRTITYGARVRANGHRHRLSFGTNHQGWDRTRAEIEVERILQEVDAGTWMPPSRRTSVKRAQVVRPDGHQLFSSFARQILDAKKSHGLADDVIADLKWRLGYLIGYFGRLELLEIDVARVDEFRDDLAKRSKLIRDAAARGGPLMRSITPKRGRPHTRIEQPLSNASINEILTLLSEIMQHAVDYGYVPVNPLKVGERSHRFLPTP
jgi:hypothetical protein